MVDQERKWCNFGFKAICGPKANNGAKCLILFLTVLFIGEEWLSLLMLRRLIKKILFWNFIAGR